MPATLPDLSPSSLESPLLGFLERTSPGARYAIYPLGRYTRACVEDLAAGVFEYDGRRLLGFIDDNAPHDTFLGKPVASLANAAKTWPLDAIILTRDTEKCDLRKRIDAFVARGLLQSVRIIDQPAPTLDTMTAHLGSYHPTCDYQPAFIDHCLRFEAARRPLSSASTLLCTFDAEAFPGADAAALQLYASVMQEVCRRFADAGFSFSLCVQLRDTPGGMIRTPDAVVRAVLDAFGPTAVELHGLDHSMPVEGYPVEWFESACDELASRYGVIPRYWAPPGWNLNWRSLRALQDVPNIRAIRGIWTGPNCRRADVTQTLRFPYRAGGIWQIPYSYVDWMFMNLWSTPLDRPGIVDQHESLADFAATSPCLIESVVHPFRFVGPDWKERLQLLGRTLTCYSRRGVSLFSVSAALDCFAA